MNAFKLRCFHSLVILRPLPTACGPFTWLRDVLTRIADHPINRIADLLPWNIGRPEHHRAAA